MKPKSHLDWARAFTRLLQDFFKERLISVVLYGSVATGRERPDSDIDLLIILEGITEGRYRRRRLLEEVHEKFNKLYGKEALPFFSTILKTPHEASQFSPLYLDMADRHQLMVDRNDFMKQILSNMKKHLVRLGAQRLRLGKIEYWDLKPDYKPGEIFEI